MLEYMAKILVIDMATEVNLVSEELFKYFKDLPPVKRSVG